MTPGTYNISIFRGGTFEIDLTASDADGPINFNETYNLAELNIYEAWWDADDPVAPEPLFTLNTANGMIAIVGTTIKLMIPAEVTAGMGFTSAVYQLKLVTDGVVPIVDFFLKGRVSVQLVR